MDRQVLKVKYVTIESFGQIPTLGGIIGPIKNPIKLNEEQIYQLLITQKNVFEVKSLEEKNIRVRLSLFNYNKDNFPIDINSVNKDIDEAKGNNIPDNINEPPQESYSEQSEKSESIDNIDDNFIMEGQQDINVSNENITEQIIEEPKVPEKEIENIVEQHVVEPPKDSEPPKVIHEQHEHKPQQNQQTKKDNNNSRNTPRKK
jgi:hypothetical protein